ncbi:hypothetical protein K443DRAFT_682358 [Laccaria amethystina LaAM-08-1]|uniref:Uncharacterized protein n=1 Tax=Laccaria amethystina LaAM-08-1 TaxID=1095629 RepID=A0A0C9X576_9AGAR|nr:hypothetical protein K443DRAFT_682358 [Laccaria amethystina LaAM-08-1]
MTSTDCRIKFKLDGIYAQSLEIKMMHAISSIVPVKSFNCSPGLLHRISLELKF